MLQQKKTLAQELDFDERAPLHHAIEYASRQEDIDSIDIIKKLCQSAPQVIHKCDIAGDTPLDIIQLAKFDANPSTNEYKRLHSIYEVLRSTSLYFNRKRWELEGYIRKKGDQRGNKSNSSRYY